MKILIDPRCRINYASYYIKGFWDAFGRNSVIFDVKPFEINQIFCDRNDYTNYMMIELHEKQIVKKIIIDFGDDPTISIKHYSWCDVYAKINITKDDLNSKLKSMSIGPSFGINFINFRTISLLVKTFFLKNKPVSFTEYVKNFLFMKIRRKRYSTYLGSASKKNYLFAISTLWYDTLTFNTTNHYRMVFFSVCKKIFKKVEGGFLYVEHNVVLDQFPQYEIYKKEITTHLYNKRVSPHEYLTKTKESTLVFNTPSVMSCHGWKLGEYFAMGKAIISTPLINEMPEDLVDNKDIALVANVADIEKKVNELFYNEDLRKDMERSSRQYFERNLSPYSVINKIAAKAFSV